MKHRTKVDQISVTKVDINVTFLSLIFGLRYELGRAVLIVPPSDEGV